MKVLHIPYGGQMVEMCTALRKLGVEATSCHFRQSALQFKPDICLHQEQMSDSEWEQSLKQFFEQAAKDFDVFHFHFGETFYPDRSDLDYLKKLGKKLVVQHRGSDVRTLEKARSFGNPYVLVKGGRDRKPWAIDANLKKLAAYIDHAIVADKELLPYVEDYYKHTHIIPQLIDIDNFLPVFPAPTETVPLIVHAPSSAPYKGTQYVLEAVERLKSEKIPFRFELIQNMPHEQALAIYQEADIIVDQLNVGSFGIFSLESLALGKMVICYIREDLYDKYPPKLPIISANPDNIYDVLKDMINKPDLRHQVGQDSRRYVEKYHDSKIVAKQLLNLYESI